MPRSLTNHIKPGLGTRLRKSREAAGLSQRGLSFEGCTAAYISRLEADQRIPSLQMVNELASRLNVDQTWLATGKTPEVENDESLAAKQREIDWLKREVKSLKERLQEIHTIARDV